MPRQHQNHIAEGRVLVASFFVLNVIAAAADIIAGGSDGMTMRALPFNAAVTVADTTIDSVPAVGVSLIVQLLYIAFGTLLFKTYQDRQAQGRVFYAFTCLGIAGLFFVQIVFFVPVMWLLMGRNMMALTPRMVVASLLGIALPYWIALAYFVAVADPEPLVQHLAALGYFGRVADFTAVTVSLPAVSSTVLFILLTVIAALCTAHYLNNSYKDNINVRMRIEMAVSATLATVIFCVLQPQHLYALTGMMTVTTSTLVAHYTTLHGSTR